MKKNDFGEMLIGALEEAVQHHEGCLSARVDRVEITARDAEGTPANPFRTTTAATGVRDDARQRMLAARDRVRRYFSPEAMAETDPVSAEVVGGSAPVEDRARIR